MNPTGRIRQQAYRDRKVVPVYISQLLPDLEEAQVIRKALLLLVDTPDGDIAWKFISKLSIDIRKAQA